MDSIKVCSYFFLILLLFLGWVFPFLARAASLRNCVRATCGRIVYSPFVMSFNERLTNSMS